MFKEREKIYEVWRMRKQKVEVAEYISFYGNVCTYSKKKIEGVEELLAHPPSYLMTTSLLWQEFQIWVARQQTAVVCGVGGGSRCR